MTRSSALGPDARDRALAAMAGVEGHDELDVLVVGGGVVGTGVALDAVTRGLTTGLLEQRDLASGTVVALQADPRRAALPGDARLRAGARGAAGARSAAHPAGAAPGAAGAVPLPAHPPRLGAAVRRLRAAAVRRHGDARQVRHGRARGTGTSPAAGSRGSRRTSSPRAITGAIRYYDCQVDDARLVVTLARTAAGHGAHVATRVKVTGFLREGERVVGVRARDLEHQRDLEVRAKVVVNAAGVWTDEIQELVGGRGALHVQASKGIHLVVPRDRIRSEAGFIVRTEKSVLFVIPWGRHWIIGTTDTPWDLDKAHPAASRADIDYVLEHVNTILREPLDHDDVEGVYAGLRPLLSGESEPTSRISREHTVVTPVPGLVMIAGGKYTTYRVMARDAVDAAAHSLNDQQPHRARLDHRPGAAARCRRLRDPLQPAGAALPPLRAARGPDRPPARPVRRARRRRARARRRRGPSWRVPLEGCDDYLAAEVVYAVTHEGARHLDDVLTRRTRISIESFDRGVRAAPAVARLMAGELGWDDARVAEEVDHYLRRVEAERRSQQMPTDQEADEARVGRGTSSDAAGFPGRPGKPADTPVLRRRVRRFWLTTPRHAAHGTPSRVALIRAAVRSARCRSAQTMRMQRHPVNPQISSSRRFSRSTACSIDSPGRRIRRYFTLPSNSAYARFRPGEVTGQLLLRISTCGTGIGSRCRQHRQSRFRYSPRTQRPSASPRTTGAFKVCGSQAIDSIRRRRWRSPWYGVDR